MRTSRVLRWTVLVAILAAFAPAPASAQLGRFLKKKLKQSIAQAVVETVVPADTAGTAGGTSAGAQPGGPGRALKGAPGRALKGAPAAVPAGPVFDEDVLEMTNAVLDNFQKGLAAEIAERKANAPKLATIRESYDYIQCTRKLEATPEGRKLREAYDNEQYERTKAREALEKLTLATCGPYPELGFQWRREAAERQAQAIEKASGLKPRQYEIIKERVIPFCTVGSSSDRGQINIPQGDVFLVYTTQEAMAVGPRCAMLSFSFKSL